MYKRSKTLCLLSLPWLFSIILAVAEPVHIPIRRSSKPRGLEHYAAMADHMRRKYGYPLAQQKRQSSENIPIINQDQDSTYVGSVSVGTPPQSFEVVLDTGSADFWLASTECTITCAGIPLFNMGKSSSLKPSTSSLTIQYGSGSVAGNLAQDTVTMGGFTIPTQTWMTVNETTANLLSGGSFSGIMGLAFSAIAATGATPFWQALLNDNLLQAPEMSLFITRFANQANVAAQEPGGTFTLGGTNSTYFQGNIEYLNMPSNIQTSFWLLELSSLTVGGQAVRIATGNAAVAAIDSGTTLIGGPTNDVLAFWSAVPGSQPVPNLQGFFSFPCATTLQVTVSFGGSYWPISNVDLNLGQFSTIPSTQCVGGIFDLSQGSTVSGSLPSWIFGDVFLKNVYSVFRAKPPSIGFAELSNAAGGSSGTPGASTTKFTQTGNPLPTHRSSNPFSAATPFIPPSIFTISLSFITTLTASCLLSL